MIARTWQGVTFKHGADGYESHVRESVIPELKSLPGFRGIYVLRKEADTQTEFTVITLWESMEAIERFAGATPDRAVVEPSGE